MASTTRYYTPLSSASAFISFPRGAQSSSSSTSIGFVHLKPNDVFFSDTVVWSNQVIATTASDASMSVINVIANSSGSNSSYAYFVHGFLQTQGISDRFFNDTSSGQFINYMTYWRKTTDLTDVYNDIRCGLGNIGLIGIKKIKFGEKIKPLSFTASSSAVYGGDVITFTNPISANEEFGYIHATYDDVNSDGPSAGLIFYDSGIVLIHGPNKEIAQSVSALKSISVQSTYKIWQLNAFCTADSDELRYPNNTSSFYNATMTGEPINNSSLTSYTAQGYQWGLSSNAVSLDRGNFYLDRLGTNWGPFVTSVGLYNDENEMMAIAKLAAPVRKPQTIPLTIRVSLDFD